MSIVILWMNLFWQLIITGGFQEPDLSNISTLVCRLRSNGIIVKVFAADNFCAADQLFHRDVNS